MRKVFVRSTLAVLSLGLLACEPANLSSDLSVTIGPKPSTVLPTGMASCTSEGNDPVTEDLASPTFSFPTFKVQWNGANNMKLSYVQLDFRSASLAGGKYQCIIAGTELALVMAGSQEIAGGNNTPISSTCGLRCGGMNFVSSVSSAYLSGTAKIVGVEVDSDGNATQVVTDVDVQLQYTKP